MEQTKIKVDADIQADVQKVWDYYTRPEHITKWNFASDDWHCPRSENDLRAGGRMFSRMEAKDGSFGFDFEAIYDEVAEPEKITYSMADGRQATTSMEPNGTGTRVEIVFDSESVNPVEMQQQGWQAILNNFKNYVENH
ncbi:MAG TPA: SRPBCC family protein [Sphingobacteriaceae bacterium]